MGRCPGCGSLGHDRGGPGPPTGPGARPRYRSVVTPGRPGRRTGAPRVSAISIGSWAEGSSPARSPCSPASRGSGSRRCSSSSSRGSRPAGIPASWSRARNPTPRSRPRPSAGDRRRRISFAPGRDLAAVLATATESASVPARGGLHPGAPRHLRHPGARWCLAGADVRRRAGRAGQDARHRRGHDRPRHEGRRPRRATGAGACRRRRPVVRWRRTLRASGGQRRQEPVRRRRRERVVRDGRRRPRTDRSHGHPGLRPAGSRAPPSGCPWRAAEPSRSRCRRWSAAPRARPGARPPVSMHDGSSWSPPCSTVPPGSGSDAPKLFGASSGGIRVDDPACDLAVAAALASASSGTCAPEGAAFVGRGLPHGPGALRGRHAPAVRRSPGGGMHPRVRASQRRSIRRPSGRAGPLGCRGRELVTGLGITPGEQRTTGVPPSDRGALRAEDDRRRPPRWFARSDLPRGIVRYANVAFMRPGRSRVKPQHTNGGGVAPRQVRGFPGPFSGRERGR